MAPKLRSRRVLFGPFFALLLENAFHTETKGSTCVVVDQSALVSPFRIVCMLKVGSASGRQVSPVIPEVSRRCDVTPEVETVTYRVYRVLSQQVCVLDKR